MILIERTDGKPIKRLEIRKGDKVPMYSKRAKIYQSSKSLSMTIKLLLLSLSAIRFENFKIPKRSNIQLYFKTIIFYMLSKYINEEHYNQEKRLKLPLWSLFWESNFELDKQSK